MKDAAEKLKAAEKKQKDAALEDIFKSASSATIDGIKVTKESVEKVYNDEVFDAKITAINNELSQKLQALQAAMNLSEIPAADTSTVNSAFARDGYVAGTSKIAFSGYCIAGTDNAYTYDKTLDTVYVYPAYDTTFTTTVSTAIKPYTDEFNDAGSSPDATAPTGDSINAVGKVAFNAVKDAAIAAINAVDLTAYSKEYNGQAKSNYDKAVEAVSDALQDINDAAKTATDATTGNTWATYKQGVLDINAIYTAPVNQQAATGSFMTALNAIPKVADEATEESKLSFAKSKVLSDLTKKINTYYDDLIATADNNILTEQLKGASANAEKIAIYQKDKQDASDNKAAALEVATYLINDKEDYKELITGYGSPFDAAAATIAGWDFSQGRTVPYLTTVTGLDNTGAIKKGYLDEPEPLAITKKVAELKEEAALLKASIEIDGTTAVEIDKALENAIDEAYKVTGDANGTVAQKLAKITLGGNTANMALEARINELLSSKDVKVNNRSYQGVGAWGIANFQQDKYDEVRAIISETKSAIKAATSIAAADEAFLAGVEKYNAIPTTTDKAKARSTKEFTDLLAKYTAEIKAYVDYKDKSLQASGADKNYSWTAGADTPTGMKKNLIDTFDDAYNVDELTAAYNAAKTEVDNLKTSAELKAAKEALDAKIAALPTTITLADKETVKALNADIEAHNDYCDLIGNTEHKVVVFAAATNAADKIKNIEDKAITDAYDAIMKDGKVTTDEKDAVEALRAAYDAFVKEYTEEDAASLTIPTLGDTKMAEAEAALAAAEVKAVEEMIAKLTVKPVDAAAVKAARAAYDALSLFQKNDVAQKYYDKLVDCEKLIGSNVETLKITASSTAKKGSITVKWTVKGDADAAQAYEIWKSTKKNSGFKKSFTTKDGTKRSYKNTKGLKKGTRYYYKVRAIAYDANGKKITSDWSNKAYRKAK